MAFKDGDFLLIEYIIRDKKTGQVIDTTDEKLAREEGIYSEEERYGPRLIIVGEGRYIKGIEELVRSMNVGEEREAEIPPEKAFGKWDRNKVKTVSISWLLRRNIHRREIEPGRIIEVEGKTAVIASVASGRVRLDFNHPLAGKTLVARVRVVKKIEDTGEKLKHLILRRAPRLDEDEVLVERDNGTLIVTFPSKVINIPTFQLVKALVVREAEKYLKPEGVKTIIFREEVMIAPPSKEEEEKTETAEEKGDETSTNESVEAEKTATEK